MEYNFLKIRKGTNTKTVLKRIDNMLYNFILNQSNNLKIQERIIIEIRTERSKK